MYRLKFWILTLGTQVAQVPQEALGAQGVQVSLGSLELKGALRSLGVRKVTILALLSNYMYRSKIENF
jgi:hypothetical protein